EGDTALVSRGSGKGCIETHQLMREVQNELRDQSGGNDYPQRRQQQGRLDGQGRRGPRGERRGSLECVPELEVLPPTRGDEGVAAPAARVEAAAQARQRAALGDPGEGVSGPE